MSNSYDVRVNNLEHKVEELSARVEVLEEFIVAYKNQALAAGAELPPVTLPSPPAGPSA